MKENALKTSKPIPPSALVEQIAARQEELGITDLQLCEALGFQRQFVLTMIMNGSVKFPITGVPALAEALSLEPAELLRKVLLDLQPGALEVIEELFNPMALTPSEINLLLHLRKLSGDQPVKPIVFDGKGVIALVGI